MRFRFGFPLLFLFAAPLFAGAGAAAPVLRPGTLKIAVDPGAVSFLPVDTEELRLSLCGGISTYDGIGPIAPRGECDLSVSPPPGIDLFLDDATPGNAPSRVSLHPEGLSPWKGSAPVATPCGLWDVSLVLDPDPEQPASELALEASGEDPAQGVFSGVLKLAVLYRFVHQDGSFRELPALLSLELSGHWAAVPAGDPRLGATASNLVLYAGFVAGEWMGFPSCATWSGTRCPVCAVPPPDVLETLDPSFQP